MVTADQVASVIIVRSGRPLMDRTHRKLNNQFAADLASGGAVTERPPGAGPVDVDALLRELGEEYENDDESPWGGANLDPGDGFRDDGIEQEWRRAGSGA